MKKHTDEGFSAFIFVHELFIKNIFMYFYFKNTFERDLKKKKKSSFADQVFTLGALNYRNGILSKYS